MSELDDRIRQALSASADRVGPADLRPEAPPTAATAGTPARGHSRWLWPTLAAAAVVLIAIGSVVLASPSKHQTATPPAGTDTATASVSPTPTGPASTSPDSTGSPSQAPTSPIETSPNSGTRVNCYFSDFGCPVTSNYVFLEPLWPWGTWAQAKQWEEVDGPAGHQPWHLDAAQTALSFTNGYLGFTDITTVTSASYHDDEAHIGVGYRNPAGALHTAAILHLVRFTPTYGNTKAGWEVVGSDDTDFSLELPAYGSRVSSPMTVAGHITGVDENIVVAVRTLDGSVTTLPGLPAGGENSPWQEQVSFDQTGVLTIVAFTGGHLTTHERFAIQGVHTS
jgi:hypothetical protein